MMMTNNTIKQNSNKPTNCNRYSVEILNRGVHHRRKIMNVPYSSISVRAHLPNFRILFFNHRSHHGVFHLFCENSWMCGQTRCCMQVHVKLNRMFAIILFTYLSWLTHLDGMLQHPCWASFQFVRYITMKYTKTMKCHSHVKFHELTEFLCANSAFQTLTKAIRK